MKISKRDAIEILKKYFEDAGLNTRLKWEDAAKQMGDNAPSQALNTLSTGEKRQLWSEYQSQSRKRQRGKERQHRTDSTDILNNSIREWIVSNIGCNNLLKFQNFAKEYYKHSWWKYIEDSEKNEIFQEMVEYSESQFYDKVKCEYNDNLSHCLSLFNSDASIFPDVMDKRLGLFKLTLNREVIKQLNAEVIWRLICEKYSSEPFFTKLYRDDILKIYIRLFKEKLQGKEKELAQLFDNKMVKYRRLFWEIIKDDILCGNIGPITNSRKSHFIFPGKASIESNFYDSLINTIKKRVKDSCNGYKEDTIFEDFVKFIAFHISNKRNQKILLFLLRHATRDGEYIYCIEMFYYIVELIQELYYTVSLQLSNMARNSNTKFLSFQQFKRYFKEKLDSALLREKLKYPIDFGNVIDMMLYTLHSDQLLTR